MRDHHSLIAWQRSHEFVLAVFRGALRVNGPGLWPVLDQLRRAALSIQLNIAEGYALHSRALFIRHLRIAYGSAVEAVDLVELLAELAPKAPIDLKALHEKGRECCRLVLGLKRRLVQLATTTVVRRGNVGPSRAAQGKPDGRIPGGAPRSPSGEGRAGDQD